VVVGLDGRVFLEESGAGNVFAFDLATGDQKWMQSTLGSGFNPVTALDRDNVLYSSTNYGMFFSIDTESGAVRWKTQLSGVLSPPVIAGPNVAFVGSNAYGFFAVDTAQHKQKWHFDVPDAGDTSSAPAVSGGVVYTVDAKNQLLYALDASTGTKRYGVPIAALPKGSPVVGVDAVYVATDAGIYAFDPVTGAPKWQQQPATPSVQPALLAYGDLASSTLAGHAFVLDRTTGMELRSLELGAKVAAPPIVDADDTAIYATDKGTVAIAKTWIKKWDSPLVGTVILATARVVILPPGQTFGEIGP
jgi:serine/threonine-protein kinase